MDKWLKFELLTSLLQARKDWEDSFGHEEEKELLIYALGEKGVMTYATQATCVGLLRLDLSVLQSLVDHGEHLDDSKKTFAPYTAEMQCHTSSALNWLLNPSLHLYTGLSCGEFHHSWLVDPKTEALVEPTPMIRDRYFGYRVVNPIDFVKEHVGFFPKLKGRNITQKVKLRALTIFQELAPPSNP